MGRHSAPDDDADELPEEAPGGVLVDDPADAGRHSRVAAEPEAPPDGESSLIELLANPDAEAGDTELAEAVETVDAVEAAEAEDAAAAAPVEPDATGPTGAEPAPAAAAEPAGKARARHSTRADLALIKAHGDVRARCLAALVVPFVVYVVVLAVVGAAGRTYLLWIFIPLVVAGVLFGAFLDAGHKRYTSVPPSPGQAQS
ncbi:MAG TPA: hypothetical protein VFU35_10315 [Jatrophihabitans sp.]|nr:hypothetical protein [Jatrophihabitans sp.]